MILFISPFIFSLLRPVVVVIVMVQNDISSSYAHTSLNWIFQPLYHKNNILHSNRCRKQKNSFRKHHKYSINWNLSNGLWMHWTWTWTYQKSMFCAMQCSFSLSLVFCVFVCSCVCVYVRAKPRFNKLNFGRVTNNNNKNKHTQQKSQLAKQHTKFDGTQRGLFGRYWSTQRFNLN